MKNKLIGVAVGVLLVVPAFASAATLTAPQVSAIIGLLQAFGVQQATIDIVYADLAPGGPTAPDTASSTPSAGVPLQTTVTAPTAAPVPPTCTLSVQATTTVPIVNVDPTRRTIYPVLSWAFTQGAKASIDAYTGPQDINVIGNAFTSFGPDGFGDVIFAPPFSIFDTSIHTYTMTVTKGGLTNTCSASI